MSQNDILSRPGGAPAAGNSEGSTRWPAQSVTTAVARPLCVVIATPLGRNGKGGMDKLSDLLIGLLDNGAVSGVRATRLTTKGGQGKILGAAVFGAAALRFFWLCSAGQVDLLHINLAVRGSLHRKWILARIATFFSIPYVVHVHSGRFDTFWKVAAPSVGRAIDRMFRSSAHIIALGPAFAALVRERLPEVADKVTVLPNATPSRPRGQHGKTPGAPVQITFLGLLCPRKGTPELIEALALLKNHAGLNGTAWRATLAGHGDVAPSRRRIADLGLADRVDIPGWLQAPAVDALLARTDIFTLPSHSEGLPMAILEAFAAGNAVVATPAAAAAGIVEHERNGLLVAQQDPVALAAALSRLITDAGLRRRLGAAGLEDHRRHYDVHPYVGRLAELWRRAAG